MFKTQAKLLNILILCLIAISSSSSKKVGLRTQWNKNWRMLGENGGIKLFNNNSDCLAHKVGGVQICKGECYPAAKWDDTKFLGEAKFFCLINHPKSESGNNKLQDLQGASTSGYWYHGDICNSYCQTTQNKLCDYTYNDSRHMFASAWYKC